LRRYRCLLRRLAIGLIKVGFEFAEIFPQGRKQAPLMESCGGMQKREDDQIFVSNHLTANFGDAYLTLQNGF